MLEFKMKKVGSKQLGFQVQTRCQGQELGIPSQIVKARHKFQSAKWLEMLKNDDFRQAVFDIMDEVIIQKFDTTQEEIDLQEE